MECAFTIDAHKAWLALPKTIVTASRLSMINSRWDKALLREIGSEKLGFRKDIYYNLSGAIGCSILRRVYIYIMVRK